MSGCPTRETTKEVSHQAQLDNFKHCKSYLLEIGMIQGRQDVAYVRSLCNQIQLPKTDDNDNTYKNGANIYPILTYGQCFSRQVPLIQAIQVTSLGCSQTLSQRKITYHTFMYCLFFHKLISMQDVSLHLNVA